MQLPAKIHEYSKTVCEQIRWKKAHSVISKELEDHIVDQKNAFVAEGLDEETAIDKAIEEMGDPIIVGSELDRTHKPKVEWGIVLLTGISLLIGLILRALVAYGTGMPLTLTNSIIGAVLGIGCMVLAYSLDFTTIGKYPKTIYFGLIALIIGVIAVTPNIHGKYFYAQSILLFFPTAFAGIVYNMRNKGYLGIIMSGVLYILPVLLGLYVPSLSSVMLITLACLMLLTTAIAKGWFNVGIVSGLLLVYVPTVVISIALFGILFDTPYRLMRLQAMVNPYLDPFGAGYIGTITRDMINNARLFGQGGLTHSQRIVLPGIEADFLLTYLIHKFGWIAFAVVMAVILAFIVRAFRLCLRQKSVLGKLVSISVLATFIIQVVIYVSGNLGYQILAQLTLPLISYDDGMATVINMTLIGIMLSVFKSGDLVRDNLTTALLRKNKLFEITDGKIIINLNIRGGQNE